jgi:hypothetical protein
MGMGLIGRRLSAGELRAVLDDPETVDALLFGDDDDDEMPEPDLDLDKSWHVVHYLLTGTAWEITEGAGEAVLGGSEIGPDGGYGPARLLDPAAVRRIVAGLDAVDPAALRVRFDPAAMVAADLYPSALTLAPQDVEPFLAPQLAELRRFYGAAAAAGQAVLVAIV